LFGIWEQDGGAIVNYYLLKMMNYLEPNHKFHCIPKVVEQLQGKELSFASFYPIRPKEFGVVPTEIIDLMNKKQIPVLNMFHIPWEYFPIVDPVHNIGGKIILHQTIHWDTDVLFQSDKLKDIDVWVTPTDFAKRILASKGIDNNKMVTIPHGVDIDKFYPHKTALRKNLGIEDDEIVITWVGRAQLTKGAHAVIPIIRQILEEYPKVKIISRAGAFRGVQKSMEMGYILDRMSNRFGNRFLYIPNWVEPSYQEELMASTDIGLCPSGHEGFSLPPLEWMASKVPVALSSIANHLELFNHENFKYGVFMDCTFDAEIVNMYPSNPEGTMVKVPKPDVIYGTLKWLIENPDERKYMGENGYKRVREHYNLAKIADAWLNLMDNVLGEESMDDRIKKELLIQ